MLLSTFTLNKLSEAAPDNSVMQQEYVFKRKFAQTSVDIICTSLTGIQVTTMKKDSASLSRTASTALGLRVGTQSTRPCVLGANLSVRYAFQFPVFCSYHSHSTVDLSPFEDGAKLQDYFDKGILARYPR